MENPNENFAGKTLLTVLIGFVIVSILAYRTMEHFQQQNDLDHGFSEEDALLALPQFKLVDSFFTINATSLGDALNPGKTPKPYIVLAGSFSKKSKADEHLEDLKKQGIKNLKRVHFSGKRDIYAIAVSHHETLESAQKEVTYLEDEFQIEAYVHKIRHKS